MMNRLARWFAVVVVLLLTGGTTPATMAQAEAPVGRFGEGYSLLMNVYTKHSSATPWMQNKTPGIGLRGDASGWIGGVFCNSTSASQLNPEQGPYSAHKRNCETSYYLARDLATDRREALGLHLMVGAVKGYHRGVRISPGPLKADLMPLVAPAVRLGPIRLSVLGVRIYHLSIEAPLRGL